MRVRLVLRQQLQNSIESEIADRTKIHQAKIARFSSAGINLMAAGAQPSPAPLVMLAHGDSWFDYPLSGNGLSLTSAQLESMGTINPAIMNVSHYGDATSEEMSWPKQQRMLDSLNDPHNWMSSGKPDAILFSGGGDDIATAGNQFCILIDYAVAGATGLNSTRFQEALGVVQASYMDLFAFRNRYAAGVPIFAHCYDFPVLNGIHPDCAGPLEYCAGNRDRQTSTDRFSWSAFSRGRRSGKQLHAC
jgi:hypothetical protein